MLPSRELDDAVGLIEIVGDVLVDPVRLCGEESVLRMSAIATGSLKLAELPDDQSVVICTHVFHGKHAVCDVYYYLGGDISMSCAQPDCDSADPVDWHTVSMASMRELDATLAGCPEIHQGYGYARTAPGLPWALCSHETEETEH